jgi:hypothetical protein
MKDIETIISGLDFKIRKLVNLHKKIKSEKESLEIEQKELLKKIENQKEKIKELEEKYKILKISKKVESVKSETDIKLKINEMVREIDKCVSLLSK